jgi:hypothetical protein
MTDGIVLHLPRYKYTPEQVILFIKRCLDAKGVPTFRTKYAGRPFEVDGKKAVVVMCWGGEGPNKEPFSRVFYDVPEEDYQIMEKLSGEWKYLLEKYAKEVDMEKLEKALGGSIVW